MLIRPLDDFSVDRLTGERLAAGPALDHELQLVALVEAADLPRRRAAVVPDPVLIAVGVEDHRPLAVTRLQAVGIELGLLLARAGVLPRPLGLDQAERLAICAPQHIVDEADSLAVRHALDAKLGILRSIERPARLAQQQIDEAVAGLGLVIVMAVRPRVRSLPCHGNLGAQLLQLLVEVLLVEQQFCQLAVLGVERGLLRLDVDGRLLQRLVAARQHGGIEGEAVRGFDFCVSAGEPEADVKQLLDRARGIAGADAPLLMDSPIAQRVDVLCLGKHRLARGTPKARLVQKGCDIVLIRQLQAGVGAKRPFHRDLDGLAGEERRGRRRHARLTLRLHRRLVHGRKFGSEEGEVGHRLLRPPR